MVLSARQKPAGQAGDGEDLGHDSKDWDGVEADVVRLE